MKPRGEHPLIVPRTDLPLLCLVENKCPEVDFVRIVEERQGLKIACVEEIAYHMGYIGSRQLRKLAAPLAKSGYGEYLERVLADGTAQ